MILIGDALKKALALGFIHIDPFDDTAIGPGSIDLTLGNDFRIFKLFQRAYHIKGDSHFEDVTKEVHVPDGKSIVIRPGKMILGITREKITLSHSIAGFLEGRSRFARFGLAVHVTAGFMQPGIANQQVLEMVNLGNAPLAIYPRTKICQMVFVRCEGRARYTGRFASQEKP